MHRPRTKQNQRVVLITTLGVVLLLLSWLSVSRYHSHMEDADTVGVERRIPAVSPRRTEQPYVAQSTVSSLPACSLLEPHPNVSHVIEDITLCFETHTCRGGSITFAFRDPDACTRTKRQLSRNATLNTFLQDAVGPDVFRYRLEGPETVAGLSEYLSGGRRGCSYRVRFPNIERRGTYQLGLEWLYQDYHAMDELTNQWPNLRKVPLLPVDASFRTQYHLQQCTLPSTVSVTCNMPVDEEAAVQRRRESLPPCNGREADTNGRWIIDSTQSGRPVYTRVRVKKIQRAPIVFQWALQPDAARRWQPDSCRMRLVPHLAAAETLAKFSQRVAIGGDSQLRALYFGMSNYLNGHADTCVRNISTIEGEARHCIENVKGSHRKLINGVQLDFVDDLFLDRFAGTERYSSYQTIIVGFAQHPASKEHWSMDKYRNAFWGKLRRALNLMQQGKLVVWYLAPQYPHTTNGFPVTVRDWRTDVRLKLFNAFAKQQCLAHGIPVVDAFSISTPFGHTSPDQAHFSNFVSFELVQAIVNIACEHFGGACSSSGS